MLYPPPPPTHTHTHTPAHSRTLPRQILDHYFGNVCELDLVFGFHKVYCILDEFIIGGEIQETSKKVGVRVGVVACQQQGRPAERRGWPGH